MPVLRPAPRHGVDWLTGEVRQWQSDGWLEAEYADELLRPRRLARRDQVHAVVDDVVAALATIGRGCRVAARALSRPRPRG